MGKRTVVVQLYFTTDKKRGDLKAEILAWLDGMLLKPKRVNTYITRR